MGWRQAGRQELEAGLLESQVVESMSQGEDEGMARMEAGPLLGPLLTGAVATECWVCAPLKASCRHGSKEAVTLIPDASRKETPTGAKSF